MDEESLQRSQKEAIAIEEAIAEKEFVREKEVPKESKELEKREEVFIEEMEKEEARKEEIQQEAQRVAAEQVETAQKKIQRERTEEEEKEKKEVKKEEEEKEEEKEEAKKKEEKEKKAEEKEEPVQEVPSDVVSIDVSSSDLDLSKLEKSLDFIPGKDFTPDKGGNFSVELDGKVLKGVQKINKDGTTTLTFEKPEWMSNKEFAAMTAAFLIAACKANGLDPAKTAMFLDKMGIQDQELKKELKEVLKAKFNLVKREQFRHFYPTPLDTRPTRG